MPPLDTVAQTRGGRGLHSGSTSTGWTRSRPDLLRDTLHFHPLAVEDAEHFGQRPKIDEFDDFTYFVVHGALPDAFATSELHIFLLPHCVVTVHHGECPALADVHARMAGATPSRTCRPRSRSCTRSSTASSTRSSPC